MKMQPTKCSHFTESMFPRTWSAAQRERADRQRLICVDLGHDLSDILLCMQRNNGPFESAVELLDALFTLEDEDFVNNFDRAYDNLRRETLHLIWTSKCGLCKEKPRTVVLLPCSELMLCNDCAKITNTCPQCKAAVTLKIETFMT